MTYIDDVRQAVLERMKQVRQQMRTYQDVPSGTRRRSEAEQRRIWERLNSLPPVYREMLMGNMAAKAGHYDGEKVACEWCKYVAKQAGMRRSKDGVAKTD